MICGKKFLCDDVGTVFFKKHYCCNCGTKLKRKKVSKLVAADSDEAKKYNFRIGVAPRSYSITGSVVFYWYEFECPICNQHFTIADVQNMDNKV